MASTEADYLNAILEDNPQITETLFKDAYLDNLLHMDTPEKRDDWLKVSGNGFMRVNIIDEEGNVLFWVPPLEQKPSVNVADINIYEVQAEVARRRSSHPAKGEAYSKAVLKNRVSDAKMTEEDRAQWKFIINRYESNGSSSNKIDLGTANEEYTDW